MNGASCPTCGLVLRWLPEQGAWGCDRCRKVVPASQVAPQAQAPQASPYAPHGGPAQAPYSPHAMPPGPPPGHVMPPPGRRSPSGLAIGLGLAGVAAAGAAVAIVLATRGGDGSGAGSRDDLVKRALAAMSEGDVEKLVKLGNPLELQSTMLDCSERDRQRKEREQDAGSDGEGDADAGDRGRDKDAADDDTDDAGIQEKRLRRQHQKLVEKTKGMKLELVSIAGEQDTARDAGRGDADGDEPRRRKGTRKGDEILKGCVLKMDIELHELVAKVRVTEPDAKEPSEGVAKLMVVEAGGSWFLVKAPRLSAGGGSIAAGLRKYRDKMCACKDARCAEDVSDDMRDWARSVRDEAKALPKDEQRALDEIDDELKACRRKLRDGGEGADDEVLAKLEELRSRMCACADRSCAGRIEQEMKDWGVEAARKRKNAKPSDEVQKKAMEIMAEYFKCTTRAMQSEATPRPPDDPPPPDDPSSSGGGLSSLPACAEYRRSIDKLLGCPRYPRTAAEAMKRDYERMEKNWAASSPSPSPAYRVGIAKSCEASAETVKKLLEQMCP